jgi:hypothetical protein
MIIDICSRLDYDNYEIVRLIKHFCVKLLKQPGGWRYFGYWYLEFSWFLVFGSWFLF